MQYQRLPTTKRPTNPPNCLRNGMSYLKAFKHSLNYCQEETEVLE